MNRVWLVFFLARFIASDRGATKSKKVTTARVVNHRLEREGPPSLESVGVWPLVIDVVVFRCQLVLAQSVAMM